MSTVTASHSLTLSKTGLKLIKAYEGFRAEDRELINGQRVVGYGHRLKNDRPRRVSKSQAERLLMTDLRPIEDMVNENVHAPLTQGQFDALVSFAFNIGIDAFLSSATLHAMNNGRPLDAANSLDVWRKSTINGQTYVVDALMRRRTAEKALFLRTDAKPKPAPTLDLPPSEDSLAVIDLEAPVFKAPEDAGLVAHVPINKISDEVAAEIASAASVTSNDEEIENDDITDAVMDVDFKEPETPEIHDNASEDKVSSTSSIVNMGMTGFRNIDVTETVLVDVDDAEVDITDISASDIEVPDIETPDEVEPKGVVTELFDTSSKTEDIEGAGNEDIAIVESDDLAFEDSILELIAPGNNELQQSQNDDPILVLNDRVDEPNPVMETAAVATAAAATTAVVAGGGSVIANAAADLSERLDALIEEAREEDETLAAAETDALSERFAQSLAGDDVDLQTLFSENEAASETEATIAALSESEPNLETVQETVKEALSEEVIPDLTPVDTATPTEVSEANTDVEVVVEETRSAALNNPEVRLEGPLQDIEETPSIELLTETHGEEIHSVEEVLPETSAQEAVSVEDAADAFAANQNGAEDYVLTETVETPVVEDVEAIVAESPFETNLTDIQEVERGLPVNERQADIVIDNLAEDDAMRSLSDTPIFIGQTETPQEVKEEGKGGLWIIIILGLLILTFAGILHFMGSSAQFGEWGASVVLSGLVVGSITVLAGLYYTARRALKPNPAAQQ